MYTLIKIKTFQTFDGGGLNATICRDGKPICFVLDDGNGGEIQYDFRNPGQTPTSYKNTTKEVATNEENDLGIFCLSLLNDEERKDLEDHITSVKSYAPELKEQLARAGYAIDLWVNKTVDEYQTKKRFDRIAKKKTLFRVEGDQPDEWRTLAKPYCPEAQAYLDKKYGDKVTEIYGVRRVS